MNTLIVDLSGVLWFGSAAALEDQLFEQLADEPDVNKVVLRCSGLGRIDFSGANVLHEMVDHAGRANIELAIEDVPDHALRLLSAVGLLTLSETRSTQDT